MATVNPKIGVSPEGSRPWRWSVAQYHQLAGAGWFDEKRVELIEGEIVEMPPIGDEHRAVGMGSIEVFRAVFGAGFVLSVQSSLILDDESEPEPDVVIARGTWRDFIGGLPVRAVVLVVEITKTTPHNDLVKKPAVYARSSIPEYWVIDLVNAELVVHRQPEQGDEPHYAEVQRLRKG